MEIPTNFKTTISDLIKDLSNTFPEHNNLWEEWNDMNDEKYQKLFEYCLTVYPERFFDILYQNEIFESDSDSNTFFLPNVDFKILFNSEGVSEQTKQTIWKYLQLILFSVVGNVKDKNVFGDTANLFEGINENDLEEKMKETMDNIGDFFKNMGLDENMEMEESNDEKEEIKFDKMEGIPDMGNLHEHLKGLFDGKIGKLAKELAEELSQDLPSMMDISGDDATSTQDILKSMIKNPKKMMNMIKTVGDKIKTKMDDGEISKEELMSEASGILSKMKEMGGTSEFNKMFKKFAGGMGMGKGAKINTAALNRMSRMESTRDRLLRKMNANKSNVNIKEGEDEKNLVFSISEEEKQQRSSIQAKMDAELIAAFEDNTEDKQVKSKPKKKKGKNKK
jgi:hypothetical protein